MARFVMGYRCYNWKNKNPVIDKARTMLQDEGLFAKNKRKIVHRITGLAVATLDGWFEGDTRDPRHTSIAALMSSFGYEEQWTKTRKIDLDKELKLAADWMHKQQRLKAAAAAAANGKAGSNVQRLRPRAGSTKVARAA